ncbi:MAG: tetratricopeptide repeat protein [Gemmatimonadetes bacterium]|nr:tetratricopeptide repeat protein [Gemmatimonadota bacterium]MYA64656.1 tetratricopeptide repeat protein [Gemmatimonadota bacterium]MYB99378.1 tetratricopeptide repeat protein [Gemmatimonadota bacterium]MYH51985.1 tetratricopeptide repeat protein [Gemmatimonadota bacterium]MYI45535.1 tetratricopeptide repeat protein [Gemmatimonadota bacterium]
MRRAALLLLVPLGACATRGDLQDLQSEVRALSARQDSISAELLRAVSEARRAALDSLDILSDSVFHFRGTASGSMRQIQRELQSLDEVVAQFQRTMDQLREDFVLQGQQFERRLEQLAQAGDSVAGGGEVEDPEPVETTGTPAAAQDLFDMAVTNKDRGLHTTALAGFTRFLDQYPLDPLAPAAYLHRGEVLTLEGRLQDAITDYLEVPKLFPTSDRIPAALYRAGALCIELEDYELARQYLERLVNTYPEDALAGQAREKLDDIP